MKQFALSFDLEEFDLPLEFGVKISEDEMLETSLKGAEVVLGLLSKHKVKATFFVTSKFYKKYPKLVKSIGKNYEIGCHGDHDKNYLKLSRDEAFESIALSKKLLEKSTGKVVGFRAPRMSTPDFSVLRDAGLEYDASSHPTYVPGRYNNLLKPRKIFKKQGIIVIPSSVTPILRLPMTWLWFRNLGLSYSKVCVRMCLLADGYANIYFHPWEFVSLDKWDIPLLIKRNTGKTVYDKLDAYISWLAGNKVRFVTLKELAKQHS